MKKIELVPSTREKVSQILVGYSFINSFIYGVLMRYQPWVHCWNSLDRRTAAQIPVSTARCQN